MHMPHSLNFDTFSSLPGAGKVGGTRAHQEDECLEGREGRFREEHFRWEVSGSGRREQRGEGPRARGSAGCARPPPPTPGSPRPCGVRPPVSSAPAAPAAPARLRASARPPARSPAAPSPGDPSVAVGCFRVCDSAGRSGRIRFGKTFLPVSCDQTSTDRGKSARGLPSPAAPKSTDESNTRAAAPFCVPAPAVNGSSCCPISSLALGGVSLWDFSHSNR
ncbi:translation initiation factor IF-2-like [Camelus ferus]|uniref:Translation initiation factor IF-2-like n=1 Tax=Camelus ferus TaxID=419612 RepID=A0A8B8RZR2_CAMFR|nr:translation initiation factor IF-2-like [Camelus ferus]